MITDSQFCAIDPFPNKQFLASWDVSIAFSKVILFLTDIFADFLCLACITQAVMQIAPVEAFDSKDAFQLHLQMYCGHTNV